MEIIYIWNKNNIFLFGYLFSHLLFYVINQKSLICLVMSLTYLQPCCLLGRNQVAVLVHSAKYLSRFERHWVWCLHPCGRRSHSFNRGTYFLDVVFTKGCCGTHIRTCQKSHSPMTVFVHLLNWDAYTPHCSGVRNHLQHWGSCIAELRGSNSTHTRITLCKQFKPGILRSHQRAEELAQ